MIETELNRELAYTSARPDVFALVPADAKNILDIGCSNGALGGALKKAVAGRTVTGIEADSEFAKQAGQNLDRVIQANLDNYDWEEIAGTRFDCIIFADVLEHLIDPKTVLLKALNSLDSSGCIIISLPNIRHISSLVSIFLKGTFPRRDRGIFDKTHLHWFTINDAKTLVSDSGLTVNTVSYSHRLGDKGGGYANKIADKIFIPLKNFILVREFFTYQFCIRAVPV